MARPRWSSNYPNRYAISSVVPYLILILISLLSPIVLAADDDTALLPSSASSSFPACGLKCPTLQQAQDSCVPPKAPKTDHATYVSCFCQSNLLSKLHSSGDGTCDDQCTSGSDRAVLQSWYKTYCDTGGKEPVPTSTATTSSATNTATATNPNSKGSQYAASQPWIKTHYGWVIMVVILIVAFTAIGIGATLLKRRHDAKNPGLYNTSRGDSSGSLFKNNFQNGSTPGPDPAAGTWPLGPGMAQPGNSRYTDPESIPNSSGTAVASPKPYDMASSQPSGSGNVEVHEVQR